MIRLLAAVAVMGLTVVVIFVVRHTGSSRAETGRTPFDPATTDRGELRRVAESISRIIAAPPDQHEVAVQTLETVRVETPGPRDLKESCVNTYRGMIRAEELQRQLSGLLLKTDGGGADGAVAVSAVATDPLRAEEVLRQARDQVELIAQSKDRCMGLYAVAIQQLGLVPAHRTGTGSGSP